VRRWWLTWTLWPRKQARRSGGLGQRAFPHGGDGEGVTTLLGRARTHCALSVAYCPHLNLIEGVWPKVKGLLMLRRFYNPVSELKKAVLVALRLLGAAEIHIQVGDTYLCYH
jgi:hypothetical protein